MNFISRVWPLVILIIPASSSLLISKVSHDAQSLGSCSRLKVNIQVVICQGLFDGLPGGGIVATRKAAGGSIRGV